MYTLQTEVRITITLPKVTFPLFPTRCLSCADSSQNTIKEALCRQRNLSFRELKSHCLKSSSALDTSDSLFEKNTNSYPSSCTFTGIENIRISPQKIPASPCSLATGLGEGKGFAKHERN